MPHLLIVYQASNCCGSEVLQLTKTTHYYYPLAAFVAPSDTTTVSPQGGGFLISSNTVSPCSVSMLVVSLTIDNQGQWHSLYCFVSLLDHRTFSLLTPD